MPHRLKGRSAIREFRKTFDTVKAPLGGLPVLKTKISNITTDELGDLIARYSAWREFTEDLHLQAFADFMAIKSEYDMKIAEIMIGQEAPTVTEKKALAESDNRVRSLSKEYTHSEIYATMIAKKLESFSNTLAILSRELTRRGITNI